MKTSRDEISANEMRTQVTTATQQQHQQHSNNKNSNESNNNEIRTGKLLSVAARVACSKRENRNTPQTANGKRQTQLGCPSSLPSPFTPLS